jgi:diguanylate cyclase (GGDEF)-like protein
MENWTAPSESEKRQRKVILITFPLGATLLLLYFFNLINNQEYLSAWGAFTFGMELLVLFAVVYFNIFPIRWVELIFYYSFVLFIVCLILLSIEIAVSNPTTGSFIFSSTLSGVTMWICIIFLSSYLILPYEQDRQYVMITCSTLFLIAVYHLLFRDGMDIRTIFRWVNTFLGIGVVLTLIYYTGRLQRFYAETDTLTGILNRRVTYEVLHKEFHRAERYKETLSIIMIDLDEFKQINDRLGHGAGDHVLREFTKIVRHSIRDIDSFGRIGGDEFILVLPTANAENAHHVAERIRTALVSHPFNIKEQVTASFGVSMLNEDRSLEELISRADAAVYEAKRKGRNSISVN